MATWDAVKTYLVGNYKLEMIGGGSLVKLLFEFGDGRSQVVFIQHHTDQNKKPTWLDFLSPIGKVAEIDLAAALRATEEYASGGISQIGDLAMLRISVPMENLDRNEIEQPLEFVCVVGDEIEKALTGQDVF
ncbi:hypothetical protein [Propionicimonas sp.]|uniref:hypothetical protein n=1 Tax=Propionicimonas sp. TaxID=1955623 RepID=UPI0017A05485|nr:hypothetical protein [Propionicimonas sp.]MBU3975924.1 hypothetical protein [Actinomycetota bacterium]MBA3020740.1 hypothetical protein [Propionicimonas sp.]MBU3985114.1 hypothetical protein [Actinomycetota bacterium]MBU4008104.1 hypothetical protein [Actinomycetota bacterium]MBU4064682.1 hypothetical protein [Actinomycetota bacterium]